MPVKNVTYSEQDRKKVLDFWNSKKNDPPTLEELVLHFTDGVEGDPRAYPSGYQVRKILLDSKIKAKTKEWEKVEPYVLSDSDKEFIKNHIGTNRVIEIARLLNPDKKIQPLGREIRAINHYLNSIKEEVVRFEEETIPDGPYQPPRTIHQILAKVNLYLNAGLSLQSMTAYQKKCLENTIKFLLAPRFLQEINNYSSIEKRRSFESEFIRGVFDKPDLLPEEVSLYINWCNDIIAASDLQKQLEKLNGILDTIADDENGKLSMSLAETIGKVTTNRNEILKRQERVYSILNTARSKRTEEKNNKSASLSALFEWFRDEENRRKMLKQAEVLKESRKNEVKRIENLTDTIMVSLGLQHDEAEF